MEDMAKGIGIGFVFGILIAAMVAVAAVFDARATTTNRVTREIRKEAAERGYGEYKADFEGNTTWQWKEEE